MPRLPRAFAAARIRWYCARTALYPPSGVGTAQPAVQMPVVCSSRSQEMPDARIPAICPSSAGRAVIVLSVKGGKAPADNGLDEGSGRGASIALPSALQCRGRSRRAAAAARSRWPAVTWSTKVGRPTADGGGGEFDEPGAGEDSAVRHRRSHPADILQRLDDPLHGRPGQPGLTGERARPNEIPVARSTSRIAPSHWMTWMPAWPYRPPFSCPACRSTGSGCAYRAEPAAPLACCPSPAACANQVKTTSQSP